MTPAQNGGVEGYNFPAFGTFKNVAAPIRVKLILNSAAARSKPSDFEQLSVEVGRIILVDDTVSLRDGLERGVIRDGISGAFLGGVKAPYEPNLRVYRMQIRYETPSGGTIHIHEFRAIQGPPTIWGFVPLKQ